MKRILSLCLAFIMCVGLVGCGENNTSAKEVKIKIEKAEYDIVLNKDVGTEIAEINISNSEDVEFILTISKSDSKIESIDYVLDLGSIKQTVSYWVSEKKNVGYSKLLDEYVCAGYNVDEKSYEDGPSIECSSDIVLNLEYLKEKRDNELDNIAISLKDLEEFGVWYYEENK